MVLALLERWRPTLRVRNLSLQGEKRPDVKRLVASLLAEREGFEPSVQLEPHTAFRERHLQPLRHLSVT